MIQEDQRAARKKPSIYDEDQTLEWRAGLAQKRGVEQRMRELQEEVRVLHGWGDKWGGG